MTRYRAEQKKLYDGIDSTPQTFSYHYDGPASNDAAHSEVVSDTLKTQRYNPAMSEYRGNSTVAVSGPDGRIDLNLFYQDDERKGSANTTLVLGSALTDSFDAPDESRWLYYPSPRDPAKTGFLRLEGDPALQMTNANTDWSVSTVRSAYLLRDQSSYANGVLVQFRLHKYQANDSPQAILAIANGAYGSAYRRWGLKYSGGNFYVHRCSENESNCVDTFLKSGIQLERWYVLQIVVDDTSGESFLLRVWERDHPESTARAQEADRNLVPAGGSWRFFTKLSDGRLWLDEYYECRMYSLQDLFFAHSHQIPDRLPVSEKGVTYTDLDITWNSLMQEKTLTFDGDGSWVGRRVTYEYNTADQGGSQGSTQYGNQTRAFEASWNNTTGLFQNYRMTLTEYYPYSDNAVWPDADYLTGLPARQSRYKCPNGTCDVSNQANLLSQSWSIYDGNGSYNQQPSQGLLTWQRTLFSCDYGDCATTSYQHFGDVNYQYDAWGNATVVTGYTKEGTYSTLARDISGSLARTSTTCYGGGEPTGGGGPIGCSDSGYRTYPLWQKNALGQTTSYYYNPDFGVPQVITDTNQVPVRAVYDTYGRISKVIRSGDSELAPTLYFTYNNYVDTTRPFYTRAEQLISGTSKFIVQKYYDGLGQMLQSRTVGATLASGTRDVLVDYFYDAYGRVTRQSTPYDVAPASGFGRSGATYTQTSYDVLGRPLSVTAPDGSYASALHLPRPGDAGQGRPQLHHP